MNGSERLLPPMQPEIVSYYTAIPDTTRLERTAQGQLEAARTREIIERYLPSAPAVVLDIGGGGGVYATWLASLGCAVHLLDLTPQHVTDAHTASAAQPHAPLTSVAIGDARALPWRDGCADVALLLGPLYHLTERADRLRALRETWRALRPGGIVFAACVSRFASLIDGLHTDALADPEFIPIVEADLRDGQHRNPTAKAHAYWTTAYFHHPQTLAAEVAAADFELMDLLAVEGPALAAPDLSAWLDDPKRRERLLRLLRAVEREPSLLGMSPHVLAVGRRG